jgi:metal-responsive CopG/Arc/MetJ family transcriptional regulator
MASTNNENKNEGNICAYEEVTGKCRKVCNAELHNLYSVQGACVVSAYVIHVEAEKCVQHFSQKI